MKIGIVAENKSDVETIQEFIKRILRKKSISISSRAAGNCGKIFSKSPAYIRELLDLGYKTIIVVHDLDNRVEETLRGQLKKTLSPVIQDKCFICIPVLEIEAWLLSDSQNIKNTFNLKKSPKDIPSPEKIKSPKESLGRIIEKYSENEKTYINNKHNPELAKNISLDKVSKKCTSFNKLFFFLQSL